MLAEMLISALFRILNFALFVAVIAYVFKRFFYYSFVERMHAQRLAQRALETERDALAARQLELDQALQEQAAQQQVLQEKIVKWQEDSAQKQRAKELERAALKQHVEQLAVERNNNYELVQMERRLIPKVQTALRNQLQNNYASNQQGSKFIDELLSVMERAV